MEALGHGHNVGSRLDVGLAPFTLAALLTDALAGMAQLGHQTGLLVFGEGTLKSMRKEGIYIVAIHQRMSGEEPRILFLHYWGKGKAVALAQAVKNALDAQAPGGK